MSPLSKSPPLHRTNYAVVLAARNAASNNGSGVHTHAARCCAALVKHKKRFYQRSSTTRGMAQNSTYSTFAVRTTLEQNVLQLAQMNGFNEEDIFGLSSRVVSASDCGERIQVRITPLTVVFIATTAAIYSLGHGLRTFTAVRRSTQPSTLSGLVK